MRLLVRSLGTGTTDTLEALDPSATIGVGIMAQITALWGVPHYSQALYFAGRRLEPARTIAEYNIPEGATVTLALRCGGSGRLPRHEHVLRANAAVAAACACDRCGCGPATPRPIAFWRCSAGCDFGEWCGRGPCIPLSSRY